MSAVRIEERAGALWVRMDREDALNSINYELLEGLDQAMDQALSLAGVRALVLTGTGRAFCAGADLTLVESTGGDSGGFEQFLADVGETLGRLETLPLPTVAAVNGLALAGGLEMILCCDLVVAAEEAKLGDAHANFGLLPGGGASVRLPRRVGPVLAKELMFTGRFLPATELRHSGLLNGVVPSKQLESSVDELVAEMSTKSPLGLSRMKQLVDESFDQSTAVGLQRELQASALHARSHDMQEGLRAFKEKRKPQFDGS